MIYWLFTEGHELLADVLIPLVCVAPLLLVTTAAALGVGIRRANDEGSNHSPLQRLLLIFCFGTILLTVTAVYLSLLGDQAVQRGRSNASLIELSSRTARHQRSGRSCWRDAGVCA